MPLLKKTRRAERKLTDGQPVSAMYIVGLFESALAAATFVSWKNSFTQAADWSIDTFANHAWMFDMP